MTEWQPIEMLPGKPCTVLLSRKDPEAVIRKYNPDKNWTPAPGRDFRFNVAYWDGQEFSQVWTGHELDEFESDDVDGNMKFTHWAPIDPPE